MSLSFQNLVANPDFTDWPSSLAIDVSQKMVEAARGWFVDFRKGTNPDVTVCLSKPQDMGLFPDQYGLRVNARNTVEGYLRIIAGLETESLSPGEYNFSVAFRRSMNEPDDNIRCHEIFLGELTQGRIRKIKTLRKIPSLNRMVRIREVPVKITTEDLAHSEEIPSKYVISFEIAGKGIIDIIQPELSASRQKGNTPPKAHTFEDRNIQSQIQFLKLSPIWRGIQLEAQDAALKEDAVSEITFVQSPSSSRSIMPVPFVQIVIPVFNAYQDLSDLIQSIRTNTHSPYQIILSDDCSNLFTSSRLEDLTSKDGRIKLIRHDKNMGYTRNINIALQSSVADYVALINSDTIVSPNWLENLMFVFSTSRDTGAVGPLSNAASWQSVPLTKTADNNWAVNSMPPGVTVDEMASYIEEFSECSFPEFPLLNGFCTVFKREALESVDFFDDDRFPEGYGEENDLCLRMRTTGWKLRVADNTYVYHKKSRSFGQERRELLTKKANMILRSKHPEIRFAEIEEIMRTSSPIVSLRQKLINHLRIEMNDVKLI